MIQYAMVEALARAIREEDLRRAGRHQPWRVRPQAARPAPTTAAGWTAVSAPQR